MLATAVIPWTPAFEFDEERFHRQVQTIAGDLTRYIYIFGTAGEGYAVSEKQFDQISKAFWLSARQAGAAPMVGIISLSTTAVIDRIERCRAIGFQTFQLSIPSWGPLSDAELDLFFAETCGRFPDCQFHHYNLLRTKRLLTAKEYKRLADTHPNLIAVKSSASDPLVVSDLLQASPRLRFYFTEVGYTLARRTHDVGLLVSISSINPARAKAFAAGDHSRREADLGEIIAMINSLKELAHNRFHMDGAFDKMQFRCSDPSFPLRLLPPYTGATEQDFDSFLASIPSGWRQSHLRQ